MRKLLMGTAAAAGAAVATSRIGSRRFDRLVRKDVDELLGMAGVPHGGIVVKEMLEGLPEPVHRYLSWAGVVGTPVAHNVHLKQRGSIRLAGGWHSLRADQWYTAQPAGFVWSARVGRGPIPLALGRDMYLDGRGHMLIRAGGAFTVVDALGAEMDQASMMRFLSEMVWFPTAFLGENVSFEPIDEFSTRVTLHDGYRNVTGTFFFDREGRPIDFRAERYRGMKSGAELATWSAPMLEYGQLGGIRLPIRAQAVWKLPGQDDPYIDVTITELDFDTDTRERRYGALKLKETSAA
jgi:uncharacterized protein DUF6544